jgi:hypothetical protein
MAYGYAAVWNAHCAIRLKPGMEVVEMEKEQHIRVLGWLYVASGVLMLLGAVGALVSLTVGGLFSGDFFETVIGPIAGVIAMLVLFVLSLPSLLTGKGLLEGKGWARVLAMVLGALNFFSFPLGTALCVYTFWVLWGKNADPYFEKHYPSHYELHS